MSCGKPEKLLWDNPIFAKPRSSVENVTKVYAQHLLEQAGLRSHPSDIPLVVLDNACGNGVVTLVLHEILADMSPKSFDITCGDLADVMVEGTKQRVQERGWNNTRVLKIDAQDTHLPSDHFTHVFTNFGPMLFPKPSEMLSECKRILQPQGMCGFTTWQKVGWVDDVRSAMQAIPGLPRFPTDREFHEAFGTGRWDDPEYIRGKLLTHGFEDIRIKAVQNVSVASNAQELRDVLRPTVLIIVTKLWTQEQRDNIDHLSLYEQIQDWLEHKYDGGPVTWQWTALVTTCLKVQSAHKQC